MAEEVKLFGVWASPFTRRVELALKIKGIPYEYTEVDLYNKSPSLLKYNPIHKKVPLLLHKEKPVAESLVILEYLDETWKDNPILPQDPHERAVARFWAKFIDEKLLPTSFSIGKEQEQALEEVHQQLKILENELKCKEFFSGHRLGGVRPAKILTEEKFPIIYEWIGKLIKIDAVNECLIPEERHQEFLKLRQQAIKHAPK